MTRVATTVGFVQSLHFLERVEFESFRLGSPAFTDELVGREAFERLEPSAEIVGVNEVCEMPSQLVVIVVVIALDRGVFDGAVHALDLTVGPRMIDLGETMFDAVLLASHPEHMR